VSPVLLITGTSSGIGLASAVRTAGAGYTVVATMRNLDKSEALRKAAADAGVTLDIRQLDVTKQAEIDGCVAGVIESYGHLDVLINNAGIANTFATIETCPMDVFRANIEVNFFGVVAMTRAALPHLRASQGRVVSMGSTRGLIAQPFNEGYSSSKFAVEGFLESLAPVAAGMGVTVVIVEPGPVSSSFGANAGVTWESLMSDAGPYSVVLEPYLAWVQRTGWPGIQTPAEVAEVVLQAVTDPDPAFRIMTSDWGRDYAQIKYADPDGSIVATMTRSWFAPPAQE
jgi:NAD(P)-dependent dehydrogenase (short-subunit alcohol dehydrogenase family)